MTSRSDDKDVKIIPLEPLYKPYLPFRNDYIAVKSINMIQNAPSAFCMERLPVFGYIRLCDVTLAVLPVPVLVWFVVCFSDFAMVYCVAVGCTNGSGSGKSFFGFPNEKGIRDQWIRKVNRQGKKRGQLWVPSKHSKLCGDHFEPACFEKDLAESIGYTGVVRQRLKPAAVPTIFPTPIGTSTASKRTKSHSRHGAAAKRRRQEKQSKGVTKAKKKKLARDRDTKSLNLGAAFQRWRDFRQQRGFKTDAELATFLLDCVCTKEDRTYKPDDLKNLRENKLKEELQRRGLDTKGLKLDLVERLVPAMKEEASVNSPGRGAEEQGNKSTKDKDDNWGEGEEEKRQKQQGDTLLEENEGRDSGGCYKEEDAEPEAECHPHESQPVSYCGHSVPDLSANADLPRTAAITTIAIKLEPDEGEHVDIKKEMKEELKIENALLLVADAGWTEPKHRQDGACPTVEVETERSGHCDRKRPRENGGHNDNEHTQKKRQDDDPKKNCAQYVPDWINKHKFPGMAARS
ncbi:uncharacterized protein LOC133404746 isoform X1 [Phycodurus eques]|uniref:uncharacterized protein LOC133404746 isoform X1 n=1 Tax=Phycodurus eques TaxID=693459 RepID=UPI002ACDBD98|nr:uncharacterized protein LOC133404746 isoform X1 [Phycodurus eques]XP_061536931.1 uncharacterized protein LOC133404746 isoform X1 [Phycodurus eques]XP_061536932.1 uncharacterized protein LOC133404746 isoform X1 [Phycodurus eques]